MHLARSGWQLLSSPLDFPLSNPSHELCLSAGLHLQYRHALPSSDSADPLWIALSSLGRSRLIRFVPHAPLLTLLVSISFHMVLATSSSLFFLLLA